MSETMPWEVALEGGGGRGGAEGELEGIRRGIKWENWNCNENILETYYLIEMIKIFINLSEWA